MKIDEHGHIEFVDLHDLPIFHSKLLVYQRISHNGNLKSSDIPSVNAFCDVKKTHITLL